MSKFKEPILINEISRRSSKKSTIRNRASIISFILIAAVYTMMISLAESLLHIHFLYGGSSVAIFWNYRQIILLSISFLLIFTSAYIIVYNIFHLSIITDIRFYGRIKAMGGTPSQIRRLLYSHVNRLCLLGIPLGVAVGYLLGEQWILPAFLRSYFYDSQYLKITSIVISIIISYLTIMVSCIRPAITAGKISVMDAMAQVDTLQINKKKKTSKDSKSTPVLFQMSLLALGRDKKRTLLIILSITIGMVLISSIYAVYRSFDEEEYLKAFVLSDYSVQGDIIEELKEILEESFPVIEDGNLYAMQSQIHLSTAAYDNMIEYYGYHHEEVSRYMLVDLKWAEEYNAMLENHTCKSTIFGIDGLVFESFYNPANILIGKIDPEKFYSGKYAIAQGMAGEENPMMQPTYDVGDEIVINGHSFEIMAIVSPSLGITGGNEKLLSGFQLTFFIPTAKLLEINPLADITKYFFNLKSELPEGVENFLEKHTYEENSKLTTVQTILDNYYEQVRSIIIVAVFIGFVITLIGIINFIHSQIATIIIRKKEFYMMYHIGLTGNQLKKLLMYEGLAYMIFALLFSYVLSSVAVGFFVEAYCRSVWSASYQFTLTPLIICTPVFLLLSMLVSYLCYKHLMKSKSHST